MYHRRVNDVELIAACKAVIRHELGLPPRADAIAELATRLQPNDAAQRPPARAPAVKRLKATLRSLRAGKPPSSSLDELTEDVRFLSLFDDEPWTAEALAKLLADIEPLDAPAATNASTRTKKPGASRRRS